MSVDLPEVTRVYENHHLDSRRWDVYKPRDSDVIITTSYKAGTTWTQQILYELFYRSQEVKPDFEAVSPWPEARFIPITKHELGLFMESIEGRRFIKSHLPLDGLPYYPEVKYLIIGRDCRDVFMSFFNHYSRYTDLAMEMMNNADRMGDPLKPCPEDPRELWQDWISKGWFEWESEGFPFWANLGHTASYWPYRHLPNFMFLHYNDMLADLKGSIEKICDFIGEKPTPEQLKTIVESTTFANVKAKVEATDIESDQMALSFKGGSSGFFFKGTNNRWRDVLTEADLVLYEEAKSRVLSLDCARWLEEGGDVL